MPIVYLLIALLAGGRRRHALSGWPVTLVLATTVVGLSVVATLLHGFGSGPTPAIAAWPAHAIAGLAPSVRVDGVTLAMLLLIGFIGAIILTFSRQYLAGDPNSDDVDQHVYRRWFGATLASVSALVVTNQLLILGLAWVATSLCLHQLLTYYNERPQALLAAHKKFLISRLADSFILTGLVIIGLHFDSFQMSVILTASSSTVFTPALTVATVLLACAAILKCAQLPFHGWLIQVMEAPTPVSALLHAGIVNIGGFLMIRFAPLMAGADLAQSLLVIAGTTTAVLAALIMTTRVSIKVMLAWSTCAQMGFMLLECGLGLYNLALLHLLAHSLYKAHSFLSAGEQAAASARRAQTPSPTRSASGFWLVAGLIGVVGVVVIWTAMPNTLTHPAVFAVLLFALASLVGDGAWSSRALVGRLVVGGAAVAGLYFFWSIILTPVAPVITTAITPAASVFVMLAFAALAIVRAVLGTAGGVARLRWLHPHVYGGFYLDQLFTRTTLLIWPPRLPTGPQRPTTRVSKTLHSEPRT